MLLVGLCAGEHRGVSTQAEGLVPVPPSLVDVPASALPWAQPRGGVGPSTAHAPEPGGVTRLGSDAMTPAVRSVTLATFPALSSDGDA